MPARDRKRPFWSKWVWKDWDAKTRDLDPVEYTAYHRLLTYAATCSPDRCSIPDDDVRLARATGLGLKAWRRVRARVLEFWPLIPRGDLPAGSTSSPEETFPRRYNERLRADASSFGQLVEDNTERVNRRLSQVATEGTTEGQRKGIYARGGQSLEVRSQTESNPNTLVRPSDSKPSTNGHRAEREHPAFPAAYAAFPRRDGRRAAAKAFDSALKRHPTYTPEDLVWAAGKYAERVKADGIEPRFIAMPATWLNQDRFREYFDEESDAATT